MWIARAFASCSAYLNARVTISRLKAARDLAFLALFHGACIGFIALRPSTTARTIGRAAAVWCQSSCSRHSPTNSPKVRGPSSASASLAATSSFPDRTPSQLVSAFRKIARHWSAALAAACFWGPSCPPSAGVVSASASATAIDAYLAISIPVWFCVRHPANLPPASVPRCYRRHIRLNFRPRARGSQCAPCARPAR
jgi:hypothetical protein